MAAEDFKLSDVPRAVYDSATREVAHFSTFFIANNEFCGSATFAILDGRPGILTARHVWDKVKSLSESDGLVGYGIADIPHCHLVPRATLTPMNLAERRSDEWGPDIELILLPGPQASSVCVRKSFYNLSKNMAERKAMALSPYGFALVAGFPDEASRSGPGQYGFAATTEQRGFGLITGVDNRVEEGEFDYIDLGVSHSSSSEAPRNFKGVSGAGIWQFPCGKKQEEPISATGYKDFCLSGVAFYQSDVTDGNQFLRGHGPKTIYDYLNRKSAERAEKSQ